MKKKLLVLLALATVSTSLMACWKEAQLNDNNVRTAKSIIKTIDAYLEGDISADAARDVIEKERQGIDENDENEANASLFSVRVLSVSTHLLGSGDVLEREEDRHKIAELIGKYRPALPTSGDFHANVTC